MSEMMVGSLYEWNQTEDRTMRTNPKLYDGVGKWYVVPEKPVVFLGLVHPEHDIKRECYKFLIADGVVLYFWANPEEREFFNPLV